MRFVFLLFSIVLAGCSDSGSGEPDPENIASVNAGQDIAVVEGLTFTLTASVYPEGGALVWTQTQGPAVQDFPEVPGLTLILQTPAVNVDTDLVFEATYTTAEGQVVRDSVVVSVTNVNMAPVAVLELDEEELPPFATYEIITVSGINSYDPDGEIRNYSWRQADSNGALEFTSSLTASTVEFEAPFVSEITNYQIELTVTDNFGESASNIIDVQIASSQDTIAANSGIDQTVDEFTLVVLDGSESVSTVSAVTCLWTQTSGTAVELSSTTDCVVQFIAPDVDSEDSLTFQLDVADGSGNTASDSVLVTVEPLNLGKLHDTGVTLCFDEMQQIDCNDSDFPIQDADAGRDAVSEFLDKSGSGPESFDYTKFDSNGDEISNDALVFSCVRDNFTGLIWEVKQPTSIPEFSDFRAVENYYSMDESLESSAVCSDTSDGCTVEQYVEAVNDSAFCGGANWRLPTYLEMMSIMDYGDLDQDSLLPAEFFPYSPNNVALGHKFYWVSDSSAEGGADDFHWVIDMATGDDAAIVESRGAYIRLVRTP